MPELPEVETVARDLRPRLVGVRIVGSRCLWSRTLRTHEPDVFARAVAGRRVEAVGRRGKLVVLELGTAEASGGSEARGGLDASGTEALLTIHLKMTGQLFVVPAGVAPDPYVRLVLELDDGRELRFRDIRKFGRVGLYAVVGPALGADASAGSNASAGPSAPSGPGAAFAGLGPEPLEADFTLTAFRERLRRRSGRIKPLLLDQAFVAGIGNIYADEALWAARLHPLRSSRSLRAADEARLYHAIRAILAEAVEHRGSSIDDYTAPDGDGEMQERLSVYQRTGEPCQHCGRPIRRVVIAGRASHFCSWCQRLPRDQRAAASRMLAGASGYRQPGPRWTDLALPGVLGTTRDEIQRAAAIAEARSRTARTRRAAASRRAAARGQATVPAAPAAPASPAAPAAPASPAAPAAPAAELPQSPRAGRP